MSTKASSRASVLEQIVHWSESRPTWQQDALRRILTEGTLKPDGINHVEALCRAAHGATEEGESVVEPLPPDRSVLPSVAAGGQSVTLLAVKNPHNVNNLPESEELRFGPSGLTVVYGNNGSGKSGYARIVKAACRARGAKVAIRANALAVSDGKPPQATFVFKTGNSEHEQRWAQGKGTILALGAVYVFDSASAIAHAESDNSAEFTPFGLDVLPELARVCDLVREQIAKREEKLRLQRPTWMSAPPVGAKTQVFKLVQRLNAFTDPSEVEALASFGEGEAKQLQSMNEALSHDPIKRAQNLNGHASRLRTLSVDVERLGAALSDDVFSRLKQCVEDYLAANQAAVVAAARNFEDGFLNGTGNRAWTLLWSAAREFSSKHAYPDSKYPRVERGSRCVLCQQVLDDNTAQRLALFEDFVADQTQAIAKNAATAVLAARQSLTQLRLRLRPDKRAAAEVELLSETERHNLRTTLGGLLHRLRAARSIVRRCDPTINVPKVASTNSNALIVLAAHFEKQAEDAVASHDPSNRAALEMNKAELEAKRWLSGIKDDCLAVLGRERQIAKLQRAIADAQTSQISTKNRELAEEAITPVLCGRFESEVKDLRLNSIQVDLVPTGTQKGKRLFKCMVRGAQKLGAAEIASEGEHRCIALAAFLAELSTATDSSTLVLDDPVSSLDHMRRKEVATRLAREAKVRQVIVFTHDLVFVEDLTGAARELDVPAVTRSIVRHGAGPGYVVDGLPWRARSVPDRIDQLRKACRKAEEDAKTLDEESASSVRRGLYDRFRDTVEVSIEKVAFANTILRYRDYVDTKQLARAAVLTDKDCVELKALFDKASDAVTGHSASTGRNAPPPELTEIMSDIDRLEAVVNAITDRHKSLKGATTTGIPRP